MRSPTQLGMALRWISFVILALVVAFGMLNFFLLGGAPKLAELILVNSALCAYIARYIQHRSSGRDAHLFAVFTSKDVEIGAPSDYIAVFVSLCVCLVITSVGPHYW